LRHVRPVGKGHFQGKKNGADAHRNSIERVFPKLGQSGTTKEIIGLLSTRGEQAATLGGGQ